MIDTLPIPPAVIEFANQNECTNITPSPRWTLQFPFQGYAVFFVDYENEEYGENIILWNEKETRFATDEEYPRIRRAIY